MKNIKPHRPQKPPANQNTRLTQMRLSKEQGAVKSSPSPKQTFEAGNEVSD